MTNNSIELLASSIPVRLTVEERSLQKLLCSALDVSEYTNRVDEVYRSRDSVIKECLYDLYKTILGLNINASKETGKKLLLQSFEGRTEEEGMSQCAEFFAGLFEIGRRYKRMNPDKMRSEYGKLISLMQDAVQLKGSLQMNIHKPIVSVYDILKNNQLLGLLDDENLPAVTSHVPISETDQPKSELIKQLSDKYSEGDSNRRNIAELCIRSLDDGQCFLRDNAESLTALIGWLKHYFHPTEGVQLNEKYGDISISRGREGSKLSHSHNQHYYYVLESLTLWQCIMSDVFNLWSAAEEDMLDERCSYRMRNTGQGVHRLKQAPRTAQVMRNHIGSAQHKMGGKWVGSQIVHLGDDVCFSFFVLHTYFPKKNKNKTK